MTVVHLDEVGGIEDRFKLFDKDWGIVGGNTEWDCGTNVTKNGIADILGHLWDVLVGNGEIETIFAGLGKNNWEGVGREVLELINVEIKWTTLGNIWNIRTRHGGKLDFGDKEGAENASIVFTDETLWEINNKNFSFIHDFTNIEAGAGLTDDIADDWVGSKGTNLV